MISTLRAVRLQKKRPIQGFTLIEILVVIGMIGILAATVLVAVNPLRQFSQARNAQRISNVNAILNAVGSRLADNKGEFVGPSCPIILTDEAVKMTSRETEGVDVRRCLVPNYIAELPIDPSSGMNTCKDVECTDGEYDTGYTISRDAYDRTTVCAPSANIDGNSIPYCATR